MPKNKGKGGKGKRKGKRNAGANEGEQELAFKQYGQEYGQVRATLGNCRVQVHCFDGKDRMAHIPGKFRKRVWINKGDFVLVSLRDFQSDRCDVVSKYTIEDARKLRSMGELPVEGAAWDDEGTDMNEGFDGYGMDDDPGASGLEGVAADSDEDDDEDDDDDGSDGDGGIPQVGCIDDMFSASTKPARGGSGGHADGSCGRGGGCDMDLFSAYSMGSDSEGEDGDDVEAHCGGSDAGARNAKPQTKSEALAVLKSIRRNNNARGNARARGKGGAAEPQKKGPITNNPAATGAGKGSVGAAAGVAIDRETRAEDTMRRSEGGQRSSGSLVSLRTNRDGSSIAGGGAGGVKPWVPKSVSHRGSYDREDRGSSHGGGGDNEWRSHRGRQSRGGSLDDEIERL